jgi:single-strand DNA-binding protein
MSSLNRVLLMGNCTRDPEMRFTPAGQPVCSFGIACNRKFKDKQTNEMREEVCFVDVDYWGEKAAAAREAGLLQKGKLVYIEGRLRFEQWEDKETKQKRSKLKVTAEKVQFAGPPSAARQAEPAAEQAPRAMSPGEEIEADNVPF